MRIAVSSLLLASLLLLPTGERVARAAGDNAIRIATLAPRNSDLAKGFLKLDQSLRTATNGAWSIKLYASGVAGDERDVIRKMRIGQMDGSVLTSVGISQILRELAVLTAAGAIESYEQLERVQKVYNSQWEAKLLENNFKLVSWGEVGLLRLFSKAPVTRPSDLKNMRPWVWPESHTMKSLWHAIGCTGVPLGVPEVYGALQTGMIDTVISTAIAVSALQWHPTLKYITKRTHGPLVGGMMISKQAWESIPADARETIFKTIRDNYREDSLNIRKTDVKAYEKLLSRGFKSPDYSPAGEKEYQDVAKRARESLIGRVYSKELLDSVMKVARGG